MTNVQADINRNLEIVNFMRRLQAYSFGFKLLMDKTYVKIISDRTEKITLLKKGTFDNMDPHFGKFGHYRFKDMWLISIFRHFLDSTVKSAKDKQEDGDKKKE